MTALRARVSGEQLVRGLYRQLVPAWLQDEAEGAPLLYSLGLLCDAVIEHGRQALLARYPEYAPEDALSLLSRDRKIVRGIAESSASFSARLVRWLDDHSTRGNPYALMRQLRGYCNAAVRVRTVDQRGNWYTIEADGTESVAGNNGGFGLPWDWDGGAASRWGRFWVIIYPTALGEPWSEGPAWGAAGLVWGAPGATWGTTATVDEVEAVRRIVRDWKPAGTRCEHIIICFDAAAMAPDDGYGAPTGDWQNASNRFAGARYWRGTREAS